MSIEDLITTGKTELPPRICVFGDPKIGKSTWAAQAPKPLFIPVDDGVDEIGVDRLPQPENFDTLMYYVSQTSETLYRTVVIDTLDKVELLIWAEVVRSAGKSSIEDLPFKEGYTRAVDYWQQLLSQLEQCRAIGQIVILLGHVAVGKVNDPAKGSYERCGLSLHKHASKLIYGWVDVIAYAHHEIVVSAERNKKSKVAAVGGGSGARVLRCGGSPQVLAGNRLGLPDVLPLDWAEFAAHSQNSYTQQSE
jgi:hypothetical protein